jgi:transcriptional regulator with PAS, ATPase and Fis domain
LPKPLVREVIKEVSVSVEVDVELFGRGAPIVSMAELERMAIAHALAETDSAIEAAKRLGMGKTTLYRKSGREFEMQRR